MLRFIITRFAWLSFLFSPISVEIAMAQSCHTTDGWQSMVRQDIRLLINNKPQNLAVRIADEGHERAAGYQWICADAAKDSAILFIFPNAFLSAFHMRNVFVPLDIYYFDASGKQIDRLLMQAEPPNKSTKPKYYRAKSAFQYALEVPRIEGTNKPLLDATWDLSLSLDSLK